MDQLARLMTVFDQEGAQQLIKSLKDVQTNSKGAETATEQLTDATKKGSAAAKTYSTGVDQMNAHVVAFTNNQKALKVANDNAAKSMNVARYAGLNLSRNLADVGVSAAGGISPLMILIQQGPQIADSFQAAALAGVSFKTVIAGMAAQVVPLVTAFAPLLLAIGAVSAAVFVLVDAHNKQDKAIKDLNKELLDHQKLLSDISPWLFKTGDNANLAAEGQRNFDAWLRTTNVSLAEQNRLLKENTVNNWWAKRAKAAGDLFEAQSKLAEVSKKGPTMMSSGAPGGFGVVAPAAATDPTNNPFYKLAAANVDIAKKSLKDINAYYDALLKAPDSAFGTPAPGGGRGRGGGASRGSVNDNFRGLRGVSGLTVDPSTVVDLNKPKDLVAYKPGGDRTIGGDPMLTSAEDASKQLQKILDQRAKNRLDTEKAMWSGLTALSSSGNKKLAAIGKAAAIAEATIDGIKAVQKAYSSLPFPFNLAAAATMAGLTAINVAKIAGVQGFAAGGYTGNGGLGSPAGVVHGQEFVVNAAATRNNRAELEAMNAGRAIPKNPVNDNGRSRQPVIYAPQYSMGSGNMVTERVHEQWQRDIADSEARMSRAVPAIVAKHQREKR